MKRMLLVLVALVMLGICFAVPTQADYDPLQVTAACEPVTLTGPQQVKVTIRITNVADGDMSDSITLYDPDGNRLESFTLKQGAYHTWTGNWNVTSEQLAEGKLKFKVGYSIYDDNTGGNQGRSKVISVTVKRAAVDAKLTGDYTITPSTANKGQTVTFTYTLSNTGNVAVERIQITNPNITDKKINIDAIAPGKKETVKFEVVMGSSALKSKPKVTYRGEGSDKVLTINMAEKTVQVAKSGLTINLTTSGETSGLPGAEFTLTWKLENKGNLTYNNLRVTDTILGDILTNIDLKPGESKTDSKKIAIQESGSHAFTVTAEDSTGAEVTLVSNEVPVIAIDPDKLLDLAVSADVSTLSIRERPATVIFTVTIANNSNVDAKEIVVKAGNTTVFTLNELLAGQTRTLSREITISREGIFKFTVSAKDGQGVVKTVDTNKIELGFLEPTPEPPPATPTPEPVEPTPTPEATPEVPANQGQGGGGGTTLLYVMGGLVITALLAVLGLVVLGRRNRPEQQVRDEMVIDYFELGARRDYTGRGTRRRSTAPRERPLGYEGEGDAVDYGAEAPLYEDDVAVQASRYGRPVAEAQATSDWETPLDQEPEQAEWQEADPAPALEAEPLAWEKAAEEPQAQLQAEPLDEGGHYRLQRRSPYEMVEDDPAEDEDTDGPVYQRRGRRKKK